MTVQHHVNHLRVCTSSADIDLPGKDNPLPFTPVADSEGSTTIFQQSPTPNSTGGLEPQSTELSVHHLRHHHWPLDRLGFNWTL